MVRRQISISSSVSYDPDVPSSSAHSRRTDPCLEFGELTWDERKKVSECTFTRTLVILIKTSSKGYLLFVSLVGTRRRECR